MAAFSSTVSATSPNAPGAKRKRKRSSTNLKKPRRRNRKRKSPMLPCPLGKNPPRRNPKRKNRKKRSRKKNPSRLNRAASTRRRPFSPGVRCEVYIHHSPDHPDLRRDLRLAWSGIRAIAALYHLRSNPRENFHARRKHHRRRHACHSRWKNLGGWLRLGPPPGGPGIQTKRVKGYPGNLQLDSQMGLREIGAVSATVDSA